MTHTQHHTRLILAVFTILIPMCAMAQRRVATQETHAEAVARQYADSLSQLVDSLYSPSTTVEPTVSNERWAPLFMPVTYYKTIANRAFDLGQDLTPIDEQLLRVYLSRPDRVTATQSDLEAAGTVIAPETVAERPALAVEPAADQPQAEAVDIVVLKPNFWTFTGEYYLQFLQNYISDNWYNGGESNYSMLGQVTMEANYNNKQKVKWDNKLELKLGMQTQKSDSLHKLKTSSDLIRYTGKLGLQATKKWYYTLQVVANTQWMRYYKTNTNTVSSDFMSPFNLNASLGMDYTVSWMKSKLTGTIHLAPLAYNFKYVGRLSLATTNGLEEGHHTLNDFGSQVTVELTWKFTDNISWKTRLYGYTTYERTEMEWENTFSFQFNKYISAKVFLYPRFDDSATRDDDLGYWQFKEYTSIGFSYSF